MSATPFDWRRARHDEVPALAAIYGESARRLGPAVYTAEQVLAWASFAADVEGFRRYVVDNDTWVACDPLGGALLGFCGVGAHDGVHEIHSLYVAAGHTRCGIGREMLARTLARARDAGATRFAAWVTPFSRPLFLAAGFALTQTVQAPFAGTMFERYRVERDF